MTAAAITQSAGVVVRAVPGRAILLVLAIGLAYHYSLLSLARGLALSTPLAYLGLVPLIALALAWHRAVRRPAWGPYDLRLDFTLGRLLGLALLATAMAVAVFVPRTTGLEFWLLRVDLLGLPIFVAGSIALLYGVRPLWNVRFAVLFLLLAWPVPYLAVMADGMNASVEATVAALVAISHVLPLATPVGGSDGLFLIGSDRGAIPVSVASACSGVNSMVGFGLAGVALFAVVRGPLLRRIAWLAVGLVLTWLLNVLRIEFIFAVGALASPQLALNVLHPVAGLIVFNVGLVIMLLVASHFGLTISLGQRPPVQPAAGSRPPTRARIATVAVVGAAAIFLGVVNASYAGFQPLGGDQGLPSISGFQPARAWVPDWSSRRVADYEHGRQFFGSESTWTRSVYTAAPGAGMRANVPVYVDVITTPDGAALAGYSVESCYSFHGYVVESSYSVDLGGGLSASLRSYTDPRANTDWTILAWEWPITVDASVLYQRVVLLMPDGDDGSFDGVPTTEIVAAGGRFADAERLLATLAHTMVANQVASEATAEAGS